MQREIPAGPARFVGRNHELSRLRNAWEGAARGYPRLVLVSGEPGAGKTRLLQEFHRELSAQGVAVAWVRAWPEAGVPALRPLLSLCETLLGEGSGAPGAVRDRWGRDLIELAARSPRLGRLLRPVTAAAGSEAEVGTIDLAASGVPFDLFDGLRAALLAYAASHPLVLVVDDAHDADPSVADFLRHLVAPPTAAPLLVVVARRLAAPEGCPLGRAQEALIRGALGAALPAEEVEALCAAAGGNAFFLNELLADYPQRGARGVPSSIREMLDALLRDLPDSVSRALSAAALIGERFSLHAVARAVATETDDGWESAFRAADAGVTLRLLAPLDREAMRYAFVHGLLREALRDAIPAARKAAGHATIARLLEELGAQGDAPVAAQVAEHWVLAGPRGTPERVAHWSFLAGGEALANFAHAEATTHLERALAHTDADDGPARAAILIRLAVASFQTGEVGRARGWLDEAVSWAERDDDPALLAETVEVEEIMSTWAIPGRGSSAFVARLEQVLASDARLARSRVLRLRGALAEHLAKIGELERAREEATVLALAARDTTIDEAARASAWVHVASVNWRAGNPRERIEWLSHAERLAKAANDSLLEKFSVLMRTAPLLACGDMESLDRDITSIREFADRSRLPFFVWAKHWLEATRAAHAGDFERAEKAAEAGFRSGQKVDSETALVQFAGSMQGIWRARGNHERLAAMLSVIPRGDTTPPAGIAINAVVRAEMGDREGAREELARIDVPRLGQIPDDLLWISTMTTFAEAAARVDYEPLLQALYDALLPFAGQNVVGGLSGASSGVVDRPLGLLARALGMREYAERHLSDAIENNARNGSRFALAQSRFDLGSILAASGDTRVLARATEVLEVARVEFDRMGAVFWRQEAARATVGAVDALAEATRDMRPTGSVACMFRRDGRLWEITIGARRVRIRDARGLQILERLLSHPGQGLHVFELHAPDPGRAEEAEAFAALRRRLGAAHEALEEARARGEPERAAALVTEKEEIRAAMVAGARAGDAVVEKARKAVTNRIRATLLQLDELDDQIARHFRRAVHSGTICRYEPEPNHRWVLSDAPAEIARPPEAARPARPVADGPPAPGKEASFRAARGGGWEIELRGARGFVRDGKGPRYLRALVMRPRQALHVFELIETTDGVALPESPSAARGLRPTRGDLHEPPDRITMVAYLQRIAELQPPDDSPLPAPAAREIQSLRAELEALAPRCAPEIERARKSVGSRLRSTLATLLEEQPELGRHFADAVELGSLCTYRPRDTPAWRFDPD